MSPWNFMKHSQIKPWWQAIQIKQSLFTPTRSKSNQADWMPPSMTFAFNTSWTTFSAPQSVFVLWLPIISLSNVAPTQHNKLHRIVVGPYNVVSPPHHHHHTVATQLVQLQACCELFSSHFTDSWFLSFALCSHWLTSAKEESRPLCVTMAAVPTAFVSYVQSMAVVALWEQQQLGFLLSPQLPLSLPAIEDELWRKESLSCSVASDSNDSETQFFFWSTTRMNSSH